MLPHFKAILFDFDGTLAIPTIDFDDMRQRLEDLTLSHGVPAAQFEGRDLLDLIAHVTVWLARRNAAQGVSYAQQAEQLLQDIEMESAKRSGLLPGITELLELLRQLDIAVGIVTRNCDVAVRVMFPQLDTYCQAFFARDHVTQVKPHPAHLQAALSHLNCSPEYALMVGDGAMDIKAGKCLHMFSIGVLTGSHTRDTLLQQGADLILDTAADLIHHLPPRQGSRR
jgi:phosphoglycolate phosphatase